MNTNLRAINTYQGTQVQSGVHAASPHRLIQLLLEGALTKLDHAKGSMHRNEIAQKGQKISAVIKIVSGLEANLDTERGGAIAENLAQLYAYIARRLVEANANNDLAILDEVSALLTEIKQGWDGIPVAADELRRQAG